MRERPILFSGPMVRAILGGRKTQTRRLVKPQPQLQDGFWHLYGAAWSEDVASIPCVPGHSLATRNPYGQPGDRLWVRETWASADCMYQTHDRDEPGVIAYQADKSARFQNPAYYEPGPVGRIDLASWNFSTLKWRPSIHMPRWASRITMEITGVRVERLNSITEEDARAEGVAPFSTWDGKGSHAQAFCHLWEDINGKRAPWSSNPWVWVVSFKKV